MRWWRGFSRPASGRPKVTLFTRPGCLLCDEVRDILIDLSRKWPVQLEEFDITSDIEVYEKYKWAVPVVALDGVERLSAPITETDLVRLLSRRSQG